MIDWITGKVREQNPPSLVIQVNGLGYEVLTPMTTFYSLSEQEDEIALYTHFIVREDAQVLYGFVDKLTRELFRRLIKVNGVGPKLALAILSGMDPRSFFQSLQDQEVMRLTRLPGVGKKTAERIIVELRDKIKDLFVQQDNDSLTLGEQAAAERLPGQPSFDEAVCGLIALGYKQAEATRAVQAVRGDQSLTSAELIRQALQAMVA